MEKKQGFFSSVREELVRGLSPGRSRAKSSGRVGSSMSGLLSRRKNHTYDNNFENPEHNVSRSGSVRTLTPLIEGPDGGEIEDCKRVGLGQWMMGHLSRAPSMANSNGFSPNSNKTRKKSDLRYLLGVMGVPLAPFYVSTADPLPHISIKDTPIETSSAQYILQQYTAASGGQKVQESIKNAYAMGKVKMLVSEYETAEGATKNKNATRDAESGGFVLWQMNPDMWYVELAVGGSKVLAGCNGKLVWRHTPWLGAHTAKGPVRPLRRALQGLDPRTTASMFADSKCIREEKINGEECFILKVCANPQTLKPGSEGPEEIIRHFLFGYFSQKTGLLVQMKDSKLTCIQSSGGDAVFCKTTTISFMEDYRPVEGIMIAHSGRSVMTLLRFGESMSRTNTIMEEAWTIEEVAFNVPGLSLDCFIPPADLRSGSISEARELPHNGREKSATSVAAHRAKVAALENTHDDDMDWKVKV